MTIKISSKDKDVRLTPDIEKSVQKKLSQRLKKYSHNQEADKVITVKIAEKKPFTRVDVDMPYLNYHIHAEAETTDGVLGGIDKCIDILERQIEKFKTRIHRSRVKSGEFKKEMLNTGDGLAPEDYPDGDSEYKIIRVEKKPVPMSIDEAVLQMEVLERKFLFFVNAETDAASVIYRRDDGNIGLIEN